MGKPAFQPLPGNAEWNAVQYNDAVEKFTEVFSGIGGQLILVNNMSDIKTFIAGNFAFTNVITTIDSIDNVRQLDGSVTPHELENIELAILPAQFGVAENAAVWLTENEMQVRVLPFICQQLAVVLQKKDILHNMQQAYERIADQQYNFGAFIAGPSKTADIEQSLVLGAHGPKSMIVFLLDNLCKPSRGSEPRLGLH